MIAYQLMVRKQKYVPINIRRHSKFIIDSDLKQEHLATLREIDLLTTQFSEIEFRKSLLEENLISSRDLENQISIRYAKNGKLETLNDNIIFSDSKQYLDISTLESTIRILSNDEDFVKKLLEKYLPDDDGIYSTREYINLDTLKILESVSKNNINLYRLKSFLLPYRDIISNKNLINNLYYCSNSDMIRALIEIFYYNEIYKRQYIRGTYSREYGDYKDCFVFNKEKMHYKRFHELAKFICDYDKSIRPIEQKEDEYQEEFLEPEELMFKEDPIIIPITKKVKKRVKKPLEGQISFFD